LTKEYGFNFNQSYGQGSKGGRVFDIAKLDGVFKKNVNQISQIFGKYLDDTLTGWKDPAVVTTVGTANWERAKTTFVA
jgi:hypothetical protein